MHSYSSSKPQKRFRFVVMSALWITGMFLFFDRVNIAMAIPFIKQDLGLSGVEAGVILSVFFWGYAAGQLFGGIAADRLKIRNWTIAFYLVWCVATAATGLCRTLLQLALVRAVFGLAEGAVINPVYKLINNWVLPRERGLANGVQINFGYLGLVIGTPVIGGLIAVYGWRAMFFISGLVTLAGVFVFWLLVYDRPRDHPWITAEERDRIEEEIAQDRVTYDPAKRSTRELSFGEGLRVLARTRAYWLLCGAYFFICGIYFTNLSWLPGYLVMERGLSGMSSGFTLILPYAAAGLGAISGGAIADRLGNRGVVILLASVLSIPAILGLLAVDGQAALIAMLGLMLFLNAAAVNATIVLIYDLIPAEVIGIAIAVLAGVFGGAGGIVGPVVMGWSYDLTDSFAMGFGAMAGGMVVAAVLMAFVLGYERRVTQEKRRKLAAAGAATSA